MAKERGGAACSTAPAVRGSAGRTPFRKVAPLPPEEHHHGSSLATIVHHNAGLLLCEPQKQQGEGSKQLCIEEAKVLDDDARTFTKKHNKGRLSIVCENKACWGGAWRRMTTLSQADACKGPVCQQDFNPVLNVSDLDQQPSFLQRFTSMARCATQCSSWPCESYIFGFEERSSLKQHSSSLGSRFNSGYAPVRSQAQNIQPPTQYPTSRLKVPDSPRFTDGELCSADGVGFILSSDLPCTKNIQTLDFEGLLEPGLQPLFC